MIENFCHPDLDDLEQLIKECAVNNRLSQEKLYRKFYPGLMLLCKRFFSDDHEALEVLNDGMIKVYKNIGTYHPDKGELFNWAYTIVRNTALDRLKLIKILPAKELHSTLNNASDDNLLQSMEWKEVYKLLDVLPPSTRVICSLFYLEGFSIAEISEVLTISIGTVKWHLSETRKKLKPVLKKYFL